MATIAKGFNWWLPFWGAMGALILLLPKMIFGNDIPTFLLSVCVAAIVGLMLLIAAAVAIRRQTLSALLMLLVFVAASWLLFRVSDDARANGRWLLKSRIYKAEVFAQPTPVKGQLKHMEWDGWGFAGTGDTVVYLVFDPEDSLAKAAKSRSPGKFSGIPCEVPGVQRLESHWYSVLFYTNTDWNHCG
jgi:hypothetical protein